MHMLIIIILIVNLIQIPNWQGFQVLWCGVSVSSIYSQQNYYVHVLDIIILGTHSQYMHWILESHSPVDSIQQSKLMH